MHFRRAMLSIVAASSMFVVSSPTPTATAAVDPTDEVIALVIEGVGFGHGRGMSQWGAYGWAVNYGRTWQWILDHYYGGTTLGSVSTGARVRVRLVAHDDRTVVGVISATSTAMWGGVGYRALQARETATPNRFDIYASTAAACPGATTSGWTRIAAAVTGPVTFTTSANEATAPAADVLGLCATDGSVTHYRGRIQVIKDNAGDNRVVNDVLVESYLRGVVSREGLDELG